MNIKAYVVDGEEIKYETRTFPSGEIFIKANLGDNSDGINTKHLRVNIEAHIRSSDDIMRLILLVDAINRLRKNITFKQLYLPYLPYSRQDRVCKHGESLSLKVFSKIINSLNFQKVITWDVHSTAAYDYIENLVNIAQTNLVHTIQSIIIDRQERGTFDKPTCGLYYVSPDAGCEKKIRETAKNNLAHGILFMSKTRVKDCIYHVISHTENMLSPSMEGRTLIVIDDICDGGATFISVAKEIRKNGITNPLLLYITHGFFSKGVDILLEHYDEIYTRFNHNNLPNAKEEGGFYVFER